MLTQYKKECLWLNEVSNATLKESIRNLDKAYTNFYKKRAELPKFKSKKLKSIVNYLFIVDTTRYILKIMWLI